MGNSTSTRSEKQGCDSHVPAIIDESINARPHSCTKDNSVRRMKRSARRGSSTTLSLRDDSNVSEGCRLEDSKHSESTKGKGKKDGSRRKRSKSGSSLKSSTRKSSTSSRKSSTRDFMECLSKMSPEEVAQIMKKYNCGKQYLPDQLKFSTQPTKKTFRSMAA